MRLSTKMDRKKFLTYVGTGTVALAAASTGLNGVVEKVQAKGHFHKPNKKKPKNGPLKFKPIEPTSKDDLVLPKGYQYNVIAAYGDPINHRGDSFGFNNDFTLYFPINNQQTHKHKGEEERGLLWVNHEYVDDLFVFGRRLENHSASQIQTVLYNQGGSIIEVVKGKNGWQLDTTSKFARRVSGLTPIQLTGPAKNSHAIGSVSMVQGTFANCSGGKTLWDTLLTCEENFENTAEVANLNETHYGWVVEVDPFDERFAVRKHTALGRFNHENTCMGLAKDGRVVVYMGDDKKDACVYKFISKEKYDPNAGKKNANLLEEGTLYVASLSKGAWLPLTVEAVRDAAGDDKEILNKFQTQADVVVNCHEASILIGGTPTDRPEDVEISPFDGSIFIAHTNNDRHGNMHGHITRFFEKDNDHGSLEFQFAIFAAGGIQSGFSAPDNLTFDEDGNLWTVTDISSSKLNNGIWEPFGNNGMFAIPTAGKDEGVAFQFASAPRDAELTGPSFTPDETTLFLSIQHPGEETESLSNPTSMWPHRSGDKMPRPGVVAITGF
ncbi:PhoX family protein [Pseudalkalibacillus decolorationis]|uniref:PhoX family protein n=1 Tax=Pseudalkalibacillus decolorationis TaxID=163879 RepID=UPI002148A5C8|nr:alkaline phosphatase PhoX [Pseudalkalibacillus decolorationis]